MKRTLSYFLALITTLIIVHPASADPTLYAAYQGLSNTVGILRVDALTLKPISSIDTSVEPSAVSIFQGNLYDVEGNTVFLRDPSTGTVLAQSSGLSGIAGMTIDADGILVLTNAATPGPNNTTIYTPSYNLLNPVNLTYTSNSLGLITDGSTYTGHLAYPSEQYSDNRAPPTFIVVASAGNRLIRSTTINLTFPGSPLQTEVGPDVSATLGTIGPTATGGGYTWSGFNGPLGIGVFASDGNLNPLIQYGFTTPAAIGGLVFQNSWLYYGASNILYRRDPLTGQTLAQSSAALPDIFGALAVDPLVLGDVNLDGHVDARDISALETALTNLNTYQSNNDLTNADLLATCDLNDDGKVTNADLQSLIQYLQTGNGSNASIPEPSTLALLTLGSLGLLVWRRLASKALS